MSTEAHKALIRRWIDEVWNQGNAAVVDELTAPDFIDHHLAPDIPPNAEGHKIWMQLCRAGFPDLHLAIDDLVAEDDKVVARMTVTGTHTSAFMGIPPTGKPINVGAIGISRIVNGKSVEYWETFDALGLMQQIGAIPTPGQSST